MPARRGGAGQAKSKWKLHKRPKLGGEVGKGLVELNHGTATYYRHSIRAGELAMVSTVCSTLSNELSSAVGS